MEREGTNLSSESPLRELTRDGVVRADELAARGIAELLVLTIPDGDIEAGQTDRGEFLVFTYTGIRNLVMSCGGGQPWTRFSTESLAEWATATEVTVLFAVDVWFPAGARYPEPDPRDVAPLEPVEHVQPITDVWIPSLPMHEGAPAARVELFSVTPGEPMLLAYQTLDDLYACCGPYQAAISVRAADLDDVARQCGAHGVLVDAVLGEDLRHQAPVVDWTRQDIFDVPDPPGAPLRKDQTHAP